jgi:hypothetical protein
MHAALLAVAAAILLSADFWNVKDPAQWSKDEIEQMLTRSPWAKASSGSFDLSKTRTGNAVNRGYLGSGPVNTGKVESMPDMRAIVRWESAKPIREAVKKPLPEEPTASYIVAIVNLPVNGGDSEANEAEMAESLKAATYLSIRGRPKWHPFRIQFDGKGSAYFFFDKEAGSIDARTPEIAFRSQFGPFEFKAKFSPGEMKYKGSPAF